jgi:hypothetical protein
VLRGERADVTDFFLMTLVDTSVVKHNMLKIIMMDSIESNSHVLTLKLFKQSAAIIWTQERAKNKRMGEIACKSAV